MSYSQLFGPQEDDTDTSAFQRYLQGEQFSALAGQNPTAVAAQQATSLPQFNAGNNPNANALLQQSMLQQQLSSQPQNTNQMMMQMMGTQAPNQFGSLPQSALGGSALMNRFSEQQSQQQQQFAANPSFLDGARANDLLSISQQHAAAGGGGAAAAVPNFQSNLRQLEMANDFLQRRLSLGRSGGTSSGNAALNASLQPQQPQLQLQPQFDAASGGFGAPNPSAIFSDRGGADKNQMGGLGAGFEQFQGFDASNLESLMAAQLQQQQQQQQQLSLQQQLMMASAQEDQRRRASLLGTSTSSAMDSSFGLPFQSMMGSQFPGGFRADMSGAPVNFSVNPPMQRPVPSSQPEATGPDETGLPNTEVTEVKQRKKKAKTFPEKLMHAIISHGDEDAVAWLPDGKSFVIVNDELFVDQVLNNAFKESKYTSFVRKLHRWGFVRLTSGTGTDCFHHPLFQKGRRDLASKITCTPRDKDGNLKTPHRNMKPPSLAGVERFIRQKADAAVAMAEAKARSREPESGDSVPPASTSSGTPPMENGGLPSQLGKDDEEGESSNGERGGNAAVQDTLVSGPERTDV